MWCEQVGLGELGLKPWEFWKLTPREFGVMLDGFYRREDRYWDKVGTLGTWVLAPYGKKDRPAPTVLELLGRTRLYLMPETKQQAREKAEIFEQAEVVRSTRKKKQPRADD